MKKLFLLFTFFLVLVSCSERNAFEHYVLDETWQPSLRVHYDLTLPGGSKFNQLREVVLTAVVGDENYRKGNTRKMLQAYADTLYANYIVDYNAVMAASDGNENLMLPFEYSYEQICTPMTSYAHYAQFKLEGNQYTGGAHGMYWEFYYVCDASSGKLLTTNDLIPSNRSGAIDMIFYHLSQMGEDFYPDFFEKESLLVENFYLSENGMTFVYNPYEVGPYALGTVEITLSWEELESLK